MRCMACGGAHIVLMKVVRDDAMAVLGFERHTFRCSACQETDRRLVFIKHSRKIDAEPLPAHPYHLLRLLQRCRMAPLPLQVCSGACLLRCAVGKGAQLAHTDDANAPSQ
jgi:hypothetical protein